MATQFFGVIAGFLFFGLILGGFAFWLWMLIDCATKETSAGNEKLVWIVIIVFTHIIGAVIYYFVRYRPRRFADWQRRSLPDS